METLLAHSPVNPSNLQPSFQRKSVLTSSPPPRGQAPATTRAGALHSKGTPGKHQLLLRPSRQDGEMMARDYCSAEGDSQRRELLLAPRLNPALLERTQFRNLIKGCSGSAESLTLPQAASPFGSFLWRAPDAACLIPVAASGQGLSPGPPPFLAAPSFHAESSCSGFQMLCISLHAGGYKRITQRGRIYLQIASLTRLHGLRVSFQDELFFTSEAKTVGCESGSPLATNRDTGWFFSQSAWWREEKAREGSAPAHVWATECRPRWAPGVCPSRALLRFFCPP